MDLNKDYKIMAGLIPIILILSVVLYIFPGATGINTNLAGPLLVNQSNNTTSNLVTNNSTSPLNQGQSVNAQDYPSSPTDSSNNNNDQKSNTNDTSNTDTGTDNSTSTDTNTPTDNPTDTNTTS